MDKRYLTIREAASYIRLSVREISRMVAAKEIPFHRIGERKLIFDVEELDAFIHGKQVAAEAIERR